MFTLKSFCSFLIQCSFIIDNTHLIIFFNILNNENYIKWISIIIVIVKVITSLFILDSNISFVFKGLYLKLFLEYVLLINIMYLYITYNYIILFCNLLLSFLYLFI